ncbi:hypothetical protein ACRRTK_022581 [Alexandromys fortis]
MAATPEATCRPRGDYSISGLLLCGSKHIKGSCSDGSCLRPNGEISIVWTDLANLHMSHVSSKASKRVTSMEEMRSILDYNTTPPIFTCIKQPARITKRAL